MAQHLLNMYVILIFVAVLYTIYQLSHVRQMLNSFVNIGTDIIRMLKKLIFHIDEEHSQLKREVQELHEVIDRYINKEHD